MDVEARPDLRTQLAVREEELYVCDQGDGTIRAVNMRSLFFHASRIGQEDPDTEESQSEEEDFATRRIRKVSVHNLSLIPEKNILDLVTPFAICAATKDNFELYVSDFCLNKVFKITIAIEEETNYIGELKELLSFDSSILLNSVALTRDEQHLFVGDGNGSNVHVCQVRGGLKTKTISNIPGPTGIAVTESRTVFVSSSKEHSLFSLKEGDLFRGPENIHKVCGGSVGHCDGIKSRRNMPTSLCAYRNIVFICDTGNKSVRMLTSAKALIPLQKRFAQYANVLRIDAIAKKDLPGTFKGHVKHVEEVVTFLNHHKHKALKSKRNTNGPDLTIPQTTRQSFLIVLESLTSLANTLTEIGHEHLLYFLKV